MTDTDPSAERDPVRAAIGLLNSMVRGGESHSEESAKVVVAGLVAYDTLRLAVAEARNAALDEAIDEVHQECWTDGTGGPATESLLAEQATTSLAIMAIRALKTNGGNENG